MFQSPGGGEASSGEKDSGSSAGHQVADGSPVEAAGEPEIKVGALCRRRSDWSVCVAINRLAVSWCKDGDITAVANEAKDNVRFLYTLDKFFGPLEQCSPVKNTGRCPAHSPTWSNQMPVSDVHQNVSSSSFFASSFPPVFVFPPPLFLSSFFHLLSRFLIFASSSPLHSHSSSSSSSSSPLPPRLCFIFFLYFFSSPYFPFPSLLLPSRVPPLPAHIFFTSFSSFSSTSFSLPLPPALLPDRPGCWSLFPV